MRKLIVEIEPNEATKDKLKTMFKEVQSYEVIEMLKMDFEEGSTVQLIECTLKEGMSIHDIKFMGKMEILSVLRSEGNKPLCLIKNKGPKESIDFLKRRDLDLIYTLPNFVSEDKLIISVIGSQEDHLQFIEIMKEYKGEIVKMSFQKAAYDKHDILSVLTDKQRDIMIAARKHGYYKYPRKIRSEELAQKIGISKGTTVEHLRKAEERLIENIFAGY
jgi:DNA-binding MarR family transcriptional regulator